jgi:hypothetical protein
VLLLGVVAQGRKLEHWQAQSNTRLTPQQIKFEEHRSELPKERITPTPYLSN